MLKKIIGLTAGILMISLVFGLLADSATAQNPPKLRYGFQKDHSYAYDIKIVAQLPDEEITHQGILTYMVLSATDDQFVLKCIGMLGKSVKADPGSSRSGPFGPGFGGPPRIPRPPHFGGPMGFGPPGFGPMSQPRKPEGTTFSRLGKTIIFGDSPSLSYLLGDQGALVIEALPEEAKANWDKQNDLGVIEREESSPFPSFHHFGPTSTSETSRGAKEQIDYAILETKGDSVRISKKFTLKTAEEGGKNHIEMSGSGEFEFDLMEGVIKSETIKYEIKINEKNVVVTVPVSVNYRLLGEAEMADMKKKSGEAAATAAQEMKARPMPDSMQEHVLKELRSGDERKISLATKMLARFGAGKDRTEVARALCQAFKKCGDPVKVEILDALEVWYVPEAEKTVVEASRSKSDPVRKKAAALLEKFKTPAATDPVAAEKNDSEKPADDATPAAPEAAKMRTWQDATGTYKLEASFVKSEANKVTLKKANGKTITLSLKKLSKEDQDYVEQLLKTQKEIPENPFE